MQFYGANCLVLSNKQNRVVIDDNMTSLGAKGVTKEGDICLFTGKHPQMTIATKLTIDMPGEYEVSNISILGMQVRSHMNESGEETAVLYKVTWGDTRVLITGHIFPKLTDDQLEEIGIVDIMFVPVGGNGNTIDAAGALQLVKSVEPKLVIPTHYADDRLKYEVPQANLDEVLHTLGMEVKETVTKLQFKQAETSDTTQLVILEATR